MSTPILATKLYIPSTRPELVYRPRLIERLNEGLHRKMTLISAPAGFGKTSVLSEWIPKSPRCVTWLSLDKEDNDSTRFWTYFIASLQGLRSDLGKDALALLQSLQAPSITSILSTLINDIAAFPDTFAMVLDDYHLIESKPIDQALTFLLEHLPPNMHLVIATREDPNLPVARLRARGQLIELRITDLRFTPSEAAEFLTQVMGLNLSADDIAALENRTEGWIAGLQLAAISMRGQKDLTRFIQSFTGSHHFIMDYLVEEILQQQPEHIQTFLLHTSILERLCGPLCDAALPDSSNSGQKTLEYLEQANLFVVPLDNERRWYRYHHLFADLLRQRLYQSAAASVGDETGGVADYHIRASSWYEANDLEIEAFQHAAAANDIERAVRLIEGKGMPLQFRGAMAPVINWLASLPTNELDARPSLWITYASALTMVGQPISKIKEVLKSAEAAVAAATLEGTKPDEKTRDQIGHIASIRAMLAVSQNKVETMLAQSRRALEYLHPDNLPVRTTASWTLGYAYQLQGDRALASRSYIEAIPISQASGNIMITIATTTSLAQVQESENQLHLAVENYRRVLRLAGDPPLPAACEAHLGLARIHYQWNDLDAARQHGQRSLQLAQQLESIDTPAASWVILGLVKLAQGDTTAATALVSKAEQFLHQHISTHRMPALVAAQVLILLTQGGCEAAADLAEKHGLPISQARVHLAKGEPSSALALLVPLRREAEARCWQDERLQVMLLQAIALDISGEKREAGQVLNDALSLAEPEGFMRIFIDEGPPMLALLEEGVKHGTASHYVLQLLGAFGKTEVKTPVPQLLNEPLTERELEVIQLFGTYLKGPEIARELMVSLNTLRTHSKNIYSKLAVNDRQAAVRRAEELDLL